MKLGRRQRPAGARYLRLRDHLAADLPVAPASWDGMPWAILDMYGNERYGDCTCAAVANLASVQGAAEGRPGVYFDPDAVVEFYLALTGGADDGAVVVDVLRLVQQLGFPRGGGYALKAWAGVDHLNGDELRAAAATFSGLYLGASLPDDYQLGATRGRWEVTGPPNRDLGHAVVLVGYDESGADLATWGELVHASWGWIGAYVDEAYVLLDEARAGVDVLSGAGLLEAAAALARETGEGG